MKKNTRSSNPAVDGLSLPVGLPIFARPVARDWRERNAPRWEAALRGISGLEAVTLAEVRWPGLKASRLGVALWLPDRAPSSEAARRECAGRVGKAIVGLPPSHKVVLVVSGELEHLFCEVDAPVFVRDASSFAERVTAARARGRANVAQEPFVRQ